MSEGYTPSKIEKFIPKVVLRFMRHSIKGKATEGMTDQQVPLTPDGRELAANKLESPVDMRYAHVAGSSRVRTHETAAAAATKNANMNPEDLGTGKLRVKNELDFEIGDTEYGKRFNEAYGAGNAMAFLVHESDELAHKTGDTTSSTYSSMAANIAKLIHHNYEVASRGTQRIESGTHDIKAGKNDFERILATHGTIQESFLLKVVEKMKGVAERDKLLDVVGKNGVDFVEGFDTTISKEGDDVQVRITYKKNGYIFDEIVPTTVLEKIIEEGKR